MSPVTRFILLVLGFLGLSIVHVFDGNSDVFVLSNLIWPFCFLACTRCSKSFGQFAVSVLAFTIGMIIRFFSFFGNLLITIPAFIVSSLYISIAYFVDWKYQKRRAKNNFGYGFLATLMFPVAWMSLYAITYFVKFGLQFRLSFFLFDSKILVQCMSLIGGCGLDFIVLWTTSVIVHSIFCDPDRKVCKQNANVFLLMVLTWAIILTFGVVRLVIGFDEEKSPTVKVAYGTGLYSGDFINFIPSEYDSNFEAFESLVRQAHAGGASVLATNEEAYLVSDVQFPSFLEIARQRARQYKMHMLLAFDIYDAELRDEGKSRNKIVWIDDKGQVICNYDKMSLIPFIETAEYESEPSELPNFTTTIDGHTVKVACAICYDSNFSNYLSKMDDDTDILILPAWDWQGITEMHYRVAGGVGIENGVAVLKPTYDGISYCGDLYGNVIKVNDTNETGYVNAQFVDLPIRGKKTLFGIIGPYLQWVCPFLFLILLFI